MGAIEEDDGNDTDEDMDMPKDSEPDGNDSDNDSDSEDDISNKEMLEEINNTLRQHARRQDKKIKALERKIDFLISILAQPTDPIPPGVSGKTWTTWSEAVKKGQPQGKGSRRTPATPGAGPLYTSRD
jgi:hypothetical protein